jgi:cell division septation protein DedD
MADEIKIPDFNLGNDFSEGGEDFQPKAHTADNAESPKPKPKLLFEDEEETMQTKNVKQDSKVKSSESTKEKLADEKTPHEEPEHKRPKRIWLYIIPILIMIIAGGSFFLQTQGYFDFSTIFAEAGKLKHKILGGKDTLSVAVHDTSKAKQKAKPAESSYENEIMRKPEEKPSAETKEKKPDETKKVESMTEKHPEKTPVQSNNTSERSKSVPTAIETVKPSATPSKTPAKISEKATVSGKVSIQVSAWKLKSKAESEVNKIRNKGIDCRLVPVSLPEKGGTWYRVMVGSYPTMEEAKRQLDKVKKTTNSENCIIREN